MKKGFISIISLVAVLALSAILGAGVYYQHNKKISASLVENVNQNENVNKEIPAEEIKTESDPAESAPEEMKQEEPEIKTVDVKNDVVETAEVKTDDQKKVDEELKKAEEARKQAEIAKKKAEEERAKAQEQIRVAEENRVKEEAERKQAEIEEQKNLADQARIAEEDKIKEEQRLEAEKIAKEQAEKEAEEAKLKISPEEEARNIRIKKANDLGDHLSALDYLLEGAMGKIYSDLKYKDTVLQDIKAIPNSFENPYNLQKYNEVLFEYNKLVSQMKRYEEERKRIKDIFDYKLSDYVDKNIPFSQDDIDYFKYNGFNFAN